MGASVKPAAGLEETPGWEDRVLTLDPRKYGRYAGAVAKKQDEIRAKRTTAANATEREALVTTAPVSAADIAGRFGAATQARDRARKAVPPTIGRAPGVASSAGGRAY